MRGLAMPMFVSSCEARQAGAFTRTFLTVQSHRSMSEAVESSSWTPQQTSHTLQANHCGKLKPNTLSWAAQASNIYVYIYIHIM